MQITAKNKRKVAEKAAISGKGSRATATALGTVTSICQATAQGNVSRETPKNQALPTKIAIFCFKNSVLPAFFTVFVRILPILSYCVARKVPPLG